MINIKRWTAVLVLAFIASLFTYSVQSEIATKSAGISIEDRQAEPDYSLKLVFFERGGPYVSNTKVDIYQNGDQMIVQQTSKGPWLFVALPNGNYRVIATREDGQTRGASVIITGEQKEISLEFDAR